jgi:hypothetical protein
MNVKELSEELESFVRNDCMNRHDDSCVMTEAYQSIKKLFDRSEEERSRLQAEKDNLLRAFAKSGPVGSSSGYETDDEAERIKSRIAVLKEDLIAKHVTIEELKYQHATQIRKLESLNRDEVTGLREALSITSKHLDKWKSVYSEDVTRLQEELNRKNALLDSFTSKRIPSGTVHKSCGRSTHDSC